MLGWPMQIRNVPITSPRFDMWLIVAVADVGAVTSIPLLPSDWGTLMLLLAGVNAVNSARLKRSMHKSFGTQRTR
jgi:hypothetical protein